MPTHTVLNTVPRLNKHCPHRRPGVTDALATKRILGIQTQLLDALIGRILDVSIDAPDADAPDAF